MNNSLKHIVKSNPWYLLHIIRNSDLFDAKWYKSQYTLGSIDPAKHYLTIGWELGYDPSPRFQTRNYLSSYPDVVISQLNPLIHYELYGKKEKRKCCFDTDEMPASYVPLANYIAHDKWPQFLSDHFNKKGLRILEIGSRVVTGSNFSTYFPDADYVGFDIYPGNNVDIVGDAHKLSSYFPEGQKFDLIYSSAVFEHLAMPWIAANEIIKLLNIGGYVFIETHYSFSAHERPWHFFQFSEQALKVLFSPAHGIECIEAGVSNPIHGVFTNGACERLRGKPVDNLFCHSEFLGKKVQEITNFSYEDIPLNEIVGDTEYPKPKIEHTNNSQ